jgi:hypothetical protein
LQPGQKLPIKATATPLLAMQFPDVAKRQGKSRSEDVVTKQTVEGSGSPEILVAYICGYINGYMMLYDVI